MAAPAPRPVHTAGRRCERETSGMAISNCRSRSGTKTRAVDRITEPLSSKNKMADRRVLEIMPSGAELEVRIHSAPAASHTNSIIGADIDCLGSGRIGQVIVSKCGKDQESSLWPSGTPSKAPAAATLTFDPITAFRPPIARPEPVKRIYLRTGGDGGGRSRRVSGNTRRLSRERQKSGLLTPDCHALRSHRRSLLPEGRRASTSSWAIRSLNKSG